MRSHWQVRWTWLLTTWMLFWNLTYLALFETVDLGSVGEFSELMSIPKGLGSNR